MQNKNTNTDTILTTKTLLTTKTPTPATTPTITATTPTPPPPLPTKQQKQLSAYLDTARTFRSSCGGCPRNVCPLARWRDRRGPRWKGPRRSLAPNTRQRERRRYDMDGNDTGGWVKRSKQNQNRHRDKLHDIYQVLVRYDMKQKRNGNKWSN